MIRKRTVRQTVPAALIAPVVLAAAIVVLAMGAALFAGCDTPYSSPNWPYGSGGGHSGGGGGGGEPNPLSMDTTPPGVITHLAALTGSGTVAFTWLDPADDDLDYIEIWAGTSALSGTVVGSISRGKQTFTGTGASGADLYYHFIAVDKAGNRSAAVNYMVKLVVIEADVTNLVGMITGANSVKLSWTDPVSSLFYQADITDNYSGAAVVPKGTEQSAWNGLSNTAYTFTVKAVAGGSSGGKTVSMSLTQDATPPGAVTGLGAIDGGFGSVELNWTNPGDTDLQYVEITCDPVSGPAQMVNVAHGTPGTYTWTGLAGGVTYTFTVTAVDHSGNKSPGVSVTGTPLDTTPPGPVTSLQGKPDDECVVLTWKDPGDADLDYIQIDYGMAPQQTGKGNGTYTWNNLTNGAAYTFTVKAVDLAGNRSAPVTIGPVIPHIITNNDVDFGDGALVHDIFTVYDKPTWEAALAAVKGGGNDRNYVVNVTAAVTGLASGNFGSVSGVKVSLRGPGYSLALGSNGSLITVGANQKLILRDLTLIGKSGNNTSLVMVNGANAALVLETGAITGNVNPSDGGGVIISNGAFTMNGGEISGNSGGNGGGMFITATSTVTMNGGIIKDNKGGYRGGGVALWDPSVRPIFYMNNGTITGNTASQGGGVSVWSGRFYMSGGTITGNTGGSVFTTGNGVVYQKTGGTVD
jgi:hypothetical protein